MKRAICSILTCLTLSQTSVSATENEDAGLGLNLTGLAYWSSQWTLIDAMKQASNGSGQLWATSNAQTYAFDTGHQNRLQLDAAGWPTSLPSDDDPDFHFVTTIIYQDNQHYPVGDYVVLYEGEGELDYVGPSLVDSQPGRDVVRLEAGQFFHLRILQTDPNANGNYIRNVRIILPGGSCSEQIDDYASSSESCAQPEDFIPFENSYASRVFHPLFIQDVQGFRTLRFMQFLSTINSPIQQWSQRPQLSDASWALENGSPLEVALMLANSINAEPWLNLPVRVSDDYVTNFAELVRDNLKSDLNFYLEFGNEIWNNAWPYNVDANYLSEQGRQRWPEAEGQELDYRLSYYGMRSYQACSITKQQFAQDALRVKCVMGGQTGVPWIAEQALSCPLYAQTSDLENCADSMDVLAVGNYFAGYFADSRYLELLNQWSTEGSQGVDKVFEEFQRGLFHELTYNPDEPDWWQAPRGGALSQAREHIQGNLDIANQHGLMLAAYESGQHLTYAGDSSAGRNDINERLFMTANRDERMGQIYQQYLNDWIEAGGGLNVLFESTGHWGPWGAFPLKEYQRQQVAPKFTHTQAFLAEQDCWWPNCQRDLSEPDNGPGQDDDDSSGDSPGDEPDEPTDPADPVDYLLTLSASAVIDTMGVRLQWQSNLPVGTTFQVLRNEQAIWHTAALDMEEFWLPLRQSYQYQIRAELDDGTVVTSNQTSIMAGDSEPPSNVEKLTALVSENGVALSWQSATDNDQVRHYKIYRNGQPYGLVGTTDYRDPWPPTGSITYEIFAQDHWDNTGEGTSVQVVIEP